MLVPRSQFFIDKGGVTVRYNLRKHLIGVIQHHHVPLLEYPVHGHGYVRLHPKIHQPARNDVCRVVQSYIIVIVIKKFFQDIIQSRIHRLYGTEKRGFPVYPVFNRRIYLIP